MMALKIDHRCSLNPSSTVCVECGRAVGNSSFLDALSDLFVHEKPRVHSQGGAVGRKKLTASMDVFAGNALDGVDAPLQPKPGPTPIVLPFLPRGKRGVEQEPTQAGNKIKRRRVGERSRSVSPVLDGGSDARSTLTFHEKQLNDPWLAVAPVAKLRKSNKRKPPRPRGVRVQPSRRNETGNGGAKANSGTVASKPKQSKYSPPKRTMLRKQVIPPMYRDPSKVYYYNKVVKAKKAKSRSAKYYFVLHYDEQSRTIRTIPLVNVGTFIGARAGRIKWKANVLDRPEPRRGSSPAKEDQRYFDMLGVKTAPCNDYVPVRSESVHKCAGVKEDSWDIFDR